ncbi:MAG: hypothetical protein ACM31O_13345, partial [Bacteroidota bacterium]
MLQREEGPLTRSFSVVKVVPVLVAAAALAGCAAQGATYGDPGARALPAGQTCQSVRAELNKLDARGVPSKVEAASRGQKLNAQSQADVDRYNQLLNDYLGARCHV